MRPSATGQPDAASHRRRSRMVSIIPAMPKQKRAIPPIRWIVVILPNFFLSMIFYFNKAASLFYLFILHCSYLQNKKFLYKHSLFLAPLRVLLKIPPIMFKDEPNLKKIREK